MTTHSAPQLTYPLARSVVLGSTLFVIWLAGAVLTGWWIYFLPATDWRVWLAAAAVLLTGIIAAVSWHRSPAGQLSWDGQYWRWQSLSYVGGGAALELAVALDLGRAMLLRLENSDGAALWLWAEKSDLPYRWLDLRRAVYSAAGAGEPTDALRSPDTLAPR